MPLPAQPGGFWPFVRLVLLWVTSLGVGSGLGVGADILIRHRLAYEANPYDGIVSRVPPPTPEQRICSHYDDQYQYSPEACALKEQKR
jgi:hypothetical protein